MSALHHDRFPSPVERTQPTAMISYASEDEAAAAEVTDELLTAGYGVWLDKYCLLPGQDWASEIRTAVARTDVTIFLISRRSATKEGFVAEELRLALETAEQQPADQISLIPVRLDDTVIPGKLSRWHHLDLREPVWFRRLQSSLNRSARPATVDVRTDDPSVEILHVDFGVRDGVLTIDSVLRSSGPTALVEIGAGLIDEDGQEYYRIADDRRLWLTAGTAVYRRFLGLSDLPRGGARRLVVTAWLGGVAGGTRVASAHGGELLSLP